MTPGNTDPSQSDISQTLWDFSRDNGSAQLTERAADHLLNVYPHGNRLTVVAYSPTNEVFAGEEGAVVTLDFAFEGVQGNYGISVENPVISNPDGENVVSGTSNGQLTLIAPDIWVNPTSLTFGAVSYQETAVLNLTLGNNGSDTLFISHAIFTNAAYFSPNLVLDTLINGQQITFPIYFHSPVEGNYPGQFVIHSNDPDEEPLIVYLYAESIIPNRMTLDNVLIPLEAMGFGGISITNLEPFVAFQCDVTLPIGVNYVEGSSELTDRAADHLIAASLLENNTIRLIVYSLNQAVFSGQSGTVLRFGVTHELGYGVYPYTLSNALIANVNEENILFSTQNGQFTIAPMPPAPFHLLEPEDDAVVHEAEVTVSWSSTTDPDPGDTWIYEVQWSLDPLFEDYFFAETADTFFIITDIEEVMEAMDLDELPDGAVIHWRVRAISGEDELTIWAGPAYEAGWMFTVELAPPTANVSGVISNECMGDPVAGASVRFGEFVTETDENGGYSLFNLVPGLYLVAIEAEGFSPLTDIEEMLEFGENFFDFTLTPLMTIPLRGSYFELISFYLIPENLAADVVFGNVAHLAIVYQDNGSVYIPSIPLNTIGNITLTEGYRVFCRQASSLTVTGSCLEPELEYNLVTGPWNWLGYPFAFQVAIQTALSEIGDYIVIAMTDDGRFWIPSIPLNMIGNMRPGEGYMLIVDQTVTFQFNPGVMRLTDTDSDNSFPSIIPGDPIPTGLPYAVIVEMTEPLRRKNPAQVELYDGDLLVGASIVDDGRDFVAVTAWKGSPELMLPGFVDGHPIGARALAADGTVLSSSENTGARFGDDPYSTITLDYSSSNAALPEKFEIISAYPNPFNSTVIAPFTIPASGNVQITLYNLQGQQVYRQHQTYTAGGAQQFTLDASRLNLGSGIYLLQMSFGGIEQVQKVIYLK